MTLQAALATARKVRLGAAGGYKTKDELTRSLSSFTADQLTSDDWSAEPVAVTLSKEALAAHWDAVTGGFTAVKSSATSPLFAALVARIYGS